MANDGGLMAKIEQWFADELVALQHEGKDVFKTADVWKHQISVTESGGIEGFSRYTPFAFVGYQDSDSAREGDYDLRQVLSFAFLIGCESKHVGVARTGDDNNLGVSKIRDLVIAHFDRTHPGEEFDCDEIYYTKDYEVIDRPKQYAIEMIFEIGQLTVN